jgi:hypothetical protein
MHVGDLDPSKKAFTVSYVGLLATLVLAALAANLVLRFAATSIWDDAYFFTRYADNHLASGVYSWNRGESPGYGLTSVAYGAWIWLLRLPGGEAPLSLWLGSLFWGIATLAGLWRLVRSQAAGDRSQRKGLSVLLFALVGMNAPHLALHFTSGMDTCLAMAWMTGYLSLWKRFQGHLSPGKSLLLGLYGGMAWFVRPDLLLFPLLLPLLQAFLGIKTLQRRMAGYLLLFTCFMVLLLMAGGVKYLGGLFPLSFYVKSLHSYGDGMSKAYWLEGVRHVGWFLLWNLPLVILMTSAIFAAYRQRLPAFSRTDRALIACLVIFLGYQALLVTPIMGYHQRLLYPVWPILVYLACKSWNVWIRLRGGVPSFPPVAKAGLLVGICIWMGAGGWIHRPRSVPVAFGRMDVGTAYEVLGRNNWPHLREFLLLGDSLTIASTELGILSAMAPGHVIYDLAGLHDSGTARYGLNTSHLLRVQQPDLIYLPHPDYAEMTEAIRSDPAFRSGYLEYPPDSLHSWLGIALRRESPFFPRMQQVLGKEESVE